MTQDTTIARAGLDTDVRATISALADRHEAACDAMKATRFRHDGLAPADATLPDLPAIPDLPPAYAEIVAFSDFQRRLWSNAVTSGPEHRDRLPTAIRPSATPAQVVAALRALREYVAGTERMATQYRADAEQAVAAYLAEQEGHVRTIAEIVASERATRLEREQAAEVERRAKEQSAAEAQAERDAWIERHGSSRLKRLLAEGIEHAAVYRDERLAAERPDWRYDVRALGRKSDPRNPPQAALDMLDEARKTASDARLVYWVVDEEMDDFGDVEADEVRGYTAEASFLGLAIVYRIEDDGTPPVVVE